MDSICFAKYRRCSSYSSHYIFKRYFLLFIYFLVFDTINSSVQSPFVVISTTPFDRKIPNKRTQNQSQSKVEEVVESFSPESADATVPLPPSLLAPDGCKTSRSQAILQKAKEKTSTATFHRLLSLFCDVIQKLPNVSLSSVTFDVLVNTQLQESGLSSVDLVNLKESICSAMNIYLAGNIS